MRTRLEVLSCARNRSRQNFRLGQKRSPQNGPARNRITVAPIEKYAEKENPAESCAQRRRGSPLRMVCKKATLQDYGRECGASGSKITRKCKTGWKNVLPVSLVCVCSFVQKPKRKTGLKSRNPFDVRIRNIFKKVPFLFPFSEGARKSSWNPKRAIEASPQQPWNDPRCPPTFGHTSTIFHY